MGKDQKMTPLLCMLLFAETNVIMILLFRTPLRKLVMFVLDRVKEGRGPIMSTVAATLFALLISCLYSIMRIQKRSMETGAVNPTDQVLLTNYILDASLMGTFYLFSNLWSQVNVWIENHILYVMRAGFCLFLGLMIDRLHYYVKSFDEFERNKSFTQTQKTYETESDWIDVYVHT